MTNEQVAAELEVSPATLYNWRCSYGGVDADAARELRELREQNARLKQPELKFHSLRHTYASLCVAAGIRPIDIVVLMGHANVRTTLDVYVHLFPDDDATEDMALLGALPTPKPTYSGNVVPLHG